MVYFYCGLRLKQKFLMKTPIILLVLTAAFFGYKLVSFSQDYYNEVLSIDLFKINISCISMLDESNLLIVVNLTNPSLKDIKVVSIIYDVYYETDPIGQQYIDLSSKPLILNAQSTLGYESSVRNIGGVQLYEDMQIHIKVKVTIESSIFGLIHKESETDYIIS